LLIADGAGMVIRKVSWDGSIATIAGNGQPSSGGGPAVGAQLASPGGVALDSAGNVFIADSGNYRIREVTPGGIIATVAGNGAYGSSGDGGPPTSAQMEPVNVALDAAGDLFLFDLPNRSIRKVSPGGIITTIAGNGIQGYSGDGSLASSASFSGPTTLAVDGGGNIYVADPGNNAIRILQPVGQSMMTTVKAQRRER
jgi:hypothetical protein